MRIGLGMALTRGGLLGGLVAKTYAEYQAAIAALPSVGLASWATNIGTSTVNFTTNAAAATGSMEGSSWNSTYQTATVARGVQHALKDEATFNAQVAGGFLLYISAQSAGVNAAVSLSRNGYTSTADAADVSGRIVRIIRWDDTLKKAFESNPSIGGAETEWVF